MKIWDRLGKNPLIAAAFSLSLVALVWELVARAGFFDVLLFPPFSSIMRRFGVEALQYGFYAAVFATVWKALTGFAIATLLGVTIGFAMAMVKGLGLALGPTVDFLRSIPATALLPIVLLLFGFGAVSKIALAAFPSALTVAVGCFYGASAASSFRVRVLRQMGASRFDVFRYVVFFESLPSMLSGMRIALSLSLVLVIVGELIVPSGMGLGILIYAAQQAFDTELVFARILASGIVGYGLNRCFVLIESRVLKWHRDETSRAGSLAL